MNHIVFCLDDNYAALLGVAMHSILTHSHAKYCFWIMHNNLSKENQNKVKGIADKFGMPVFFVPVDENKELLEFRKPKIWANKVCYYRMLAPIKIPLVAKKHNIKVEKLLFIDCDILVTGDLAPIFETELRDKILAAVASPLHDEEKVHIPELGISKTHKFFYAGLMFIDCQKWQDCKIYEKSVEIDRAHPDGLKWADMDILNIIFQDDYVILPPKYSIWPGLNFKPYLFEYNNFLDGYRGIYDDGLVRDAFRNPVVLQLAGGAKPWRECCRFAIVWRWFINSFRTPYRQAGIKYIKNKIRKIK
jgi:lipopolysaccharide biosynthesis glycosyltransferase